jgi:hypothetical protein
MASCIYNRFFYNLATGRIVVGTDVLTVALVDSTYTPNKDHTDWASGRDPYDSEVTGSAYTAGGANLSGAVSTAVDASDLANIDASDLSWATSTITARYAVIYDNTLANNDLICCFDFGSDKSSANGAFTLQWNAAGIMTLQQS